MRRSNVYGTSTTRPESVRTRTSRRSLKPTGCKSVPSRIGRRTAKNPLPGSDVRRAAGSRNCEIRDDSRLTTRRQGPLSPSSRPPGVYRLATAISAPAVSASISVGTMCGGCWRSPSITTTMSSETLSRTSATARAKPRRVELWFKQTVGLPRAISRISHVVPSVLSSANSMRNRASPSAAVTCSTNGPGFPRSLKVGTITAIVGVLLDGMELNWRLTGGGSARA